MGDEYGGHRKCHSDPMLKAVSGVRFVSSWIEQVHDLVQRNGTPLAELQKGEFSRIEPQTS